MQGNGGGDPPRLQGLTRQAMIDLMRELLGEERLAVVMEQVAQLTAVQVPQDGGADMDQANALR